MPLKQEPNNFVTESCHHLNCPSLFAQSIPPDYQDFVNCVVTFCISGLNAYSSFSPVTVRTCAIPSGERSSMICMKLISANLAARFRSNGTGLEGSTRA